MMGTVPFGVYVHIPFCASRCDYCDFATWTDRAHLIDQYVDALLLDLARQRDMPAATSVFFGGGTPSLLPADQLLRVLDAIERADGAEVTVECNPDSADAAKLEQYAAGGVNRVSLGVQSMAPHVLRALGRTHVPHNVGRAVADARSAGIGRVNLDLIYGTPGETVDDWAATLDATIALGPDHISAYALTVEPATPMGRRVAAAEQAAPDDDDQATKYELADARLEASGYHWYEISNWAKPGEESRHNLLYWTGGEYAGIGCAAHAHRGGRRSWTVRTPDRYIAALRAGESPEAGAEHLAPDAHAEEALGLALRTNRGIAPRTSSGPAQRDAERAGPAAAVAELTDAGMLTVADDGRVVLTRRGRLLATDVTARLLLAGVGTRYH
jgi:oxygen-independent coproporphyrinogen-3 oxidase